MRQQKADLLERKKAEEARILADVHAQMEADKQRAAAKMEAAKHAMAAARADNEERLRCKAEAEAKQRMADEQAMRTAIA